MNKYEKQFIEKQFIEKQFIVLITGPTAVGKTDISLQLAKHFKSEIINCDASQFKRQLNIGTAKIDLSTTDIIHHLVDIINPDEKYSIADFQKKSRELISDIFSRGKIPFLVGGSGLYINSCIYDYDLSANKRSDDKYKKYSNEELHALLQKIDYESSLKIHANNRKRVERAIELASTGKVLSENICDKTPIYNVLGYCLNTSRDTLYQRINERVEVMFDNGWIDECYNLLKEGYKLDDIDDIGYKIINLYIQKEISLEDAKNEIKKQTRHYAKRQLTWFRNKMDLNFININYDRKQETIDLIKEDIITKISS